MGVGVDVVSWGECETFMKMIASSTGLLLWLWIVEINIYLEPVCTTNTAPLPSPFGWVETINVVKRVTADSESNWCPQMFNVLVQCIWNSIANNTNALAMVLLSNRNVLVLVLRIVQGSRIGIRKCFNHTQLNHLGHSCTLVLVLLYTFLGTEFDIPTIIKAYNFVNISLWGW